MALPLHAWETYRVPPGEPIRLSKLSTDSTRLVPDKSSARTLLKHYRRQIDELAAALAAEERRSLLIVLQGMDASGKDGAVKRVFTGVNPQNCAVVSFKPPDHEERQHDYLWRVYRALPARGRLGVFNRSQYEDVIARYGRREISHREAHRRLRQIADIERIWTENGMVLRKLFLHIGRSEQTRRFQARLDNPEKHWKIQQSDFDDRRHWRRFQHSYEESLTRTSTPDFPWYVIPADHKWYRDVAVAGLVLHALKQMKPKTPHPRIDKSRFRL